MSPRADADGGGSAPSEATPLLSHARSSESLSRTSKGGLIRLYLVTFLLSTSFMLTSTTLLYSVREAVCASTQTGSGGLIDNCSTREVDARTAKEVSYMVTLTTISGTCVQTLVALATQELNLLSSQAVSTCSRPGGSRANSE